MSEPDKLSPEQQKLVAKAAIYAGISVGAKLEAERLLNEAGISPAQREKITEFVASYESRKR